MRDSSLKCLCSTFHVRFGGQTRVALYTSIMCDSLGVQMQSYSLFSPLITPIFLCYQEYAIIYLLRHHFKLSKNPKFLVQKSQHCTSSPLNSTAVSVAATRCRCLKLVWVRPQHALAQNCGDTFAGAGPGQPTSATCQALT